MRLLAPILRFACPADFCTSLGSGEIFWVTISHERFFLCGRSPQFRGIMRSLCSTAIRSFVVLIQQLPQFILDRNSLRKQTGVRLADRTVKQMALRTSFFVLPKRKNMRIRYIGIWIYIVDVFDPQLERFLRAKHAGACGSKQITALYSLAAVFNDLKEGIFLSMQRAGMNLILLTGLFSILILKAI